MTSFGKALLQYCLDEMDFYSPDVREAFATLRDRDPAL